MKLKLFFFGLCAMPFLGTAQVVDTTGAGVDIYISSPSDTFYTMFSDFSGVKVTGHDSGVVWIDNPQTDVEMSTASRVTDISDVILILSDSMTLDLDQANRPEIKGGLYLGFHTELYNDGTDYTHFGDNQQYGYSERFVRQRSYLVAPALKDAEREMLNFNELFALHFWDNTTVAWVTGHDPDSSSWNSTPGLGVDANSGAEDYTTFSAADHSYQYTENHEGNTYVSEKFLPQMVDNGRALAMYYGDTLGTAYNVSTVTYDTIHSRDGFHDGDITLDVTNNAPPGAFFGNWHLVGNPYKSSLDVNAFLSEDFATATVNPSSQNGIFASRTLSILTDVNTTNATFEPGYIVVNPAGMVVGMNNELGTTGFTGVVPTVSTLAPGQGFFIFHTYTPGTAVGVKYENSMRTTGQENLMKQSQLTEPIVYVDVKQVGIEDLPESQNELKSRRQNQFAIALSDDIDPLDFNASTFKQDLSSNPDQFLSKRDVNVYVQDKHEDLGGYGIKALSTDYVNKLVPVGFESKANNVAYEFYISNQINFDEYDVFVVDRLLNTEHNMTKNGAYQFSIFNAGKQQDRFFLKFKHSEEIGFEEVVDVYSNGEVVFVSSNSQNTEIEQLDLYDVTGRLVRHLEPNTLQFFQTNISDLPKAMYMVRVVANGKVYNSKALTKN